MGRYPYTIRVAGQAVRPLELKPVHDPQADSGYVRGIGIGRPKIFAPDQLHENAFAILVSFKLVDPFQASRSPIRRLRCKNHKVRPANQRKGFTVCMLVGHTTRSQQRN